MTNNPTIDGVSRGLRELLERVVGKPTGKPNWDALDENRIAADEELRALLDAPPVERQLLPCPLCGKEPRYVPADYVDEHGQPWPFAECNPCNVGAPVEFWNKRTGFDYSAHALQSTIAQLEDKLSKAINLDFQRRETIAGLEARVQELESGRGEPVLWFKRLAGVSCKSNGQAYDVMFAECLGYQPLFSGACKFALPERMTRQQIINNTHWSEGWNACLDAAALNGDKK